MASEVWIPPHGEGEASDSGKDVVSDIRSQDTVCPQISCELGEPSVVVGHSFLHLVWRDHPEDVRAFVGVGEQRQHGMVSDGIEERPDDCGHHVDGCPRAVSCDLGQGRAQLVFDFAEHLHHQLILRLVQQVEGALGNADLTGEVGNRHRPHARGFDSPAGEAAQLLFEEFPLPSGKWTWHRLPACDTVTEGDYTVIPICLQDVIEETDVTRRTSNRPTHTGEIQMKLTTLLAVFLVAVAACGGGDSTDSPTGDAPDVGGACLADDPDCQDNPSDGSDDPITPTDSLSVADVLGAGTIDGPFVVTGYLFVDADGSAVLCDMILESFPPQCGGDSIPVRGDIAFLDDELSAEGNLRWSDNPVRLEGTFDGTAFVVS